VGAFRRAWLALLLAALPAAAQADERILHFWSDIQVQRDASVEVTETIDVRAEHDRINHGIFRDFPTRYQGRLGRQVHIDFTFEGATLDGMPVPASTEVINHGVRIKLGDPDKYVEEGEHRYVIRYRATRELGFFPQYDELYWNVTGTGWIFPIDVAEARIHLPAPAKFGQRAAYTGAEGSTASNAEVIEEKPGEIAFATFRQGVRAAILETFVWHAAHSLQRTLSNIADVILETYAEIGSVALTAEERPYRPADLLAADGDQLYVAREEPLGIVEVTVERSALG